MAVNDPVAIPLADRTGFLAQKVGTLFLQAVGERLGELGLGNRPFFVLAGVEQGAPISQQDLSRALSIDPTTMVALVDELEQGGFVQRTRNARDRRRYDVTLTAAGAKALAAAQQAMNEVEEEFFSPLSDAERRRYHVYLEKLLEGRWP
jgi:MarR family transcriptional regulator, lower aerobic nicotinate degradation pathway regulator